MTALVLYGINNCDTVKKARRFLDDHQIAYQFYDYKKQPVTTELLQQFLQHFSWQDLLNRRGTTWRRLDEQQKAQINSAESAIPLMIAHPSIIKRPILSNGKHYLLGFDAEQYQQTLQELGYE